MKLTVLFLLIAVFHVSASTYAQKISLSEKNTPLEQVFQKIRTQTGYDILYTTSLLKGSRPVTLKVTNGNIDDVLKRVFDGQPLEYSIEDKSVVVSKKQETLFEKAINLFAIPVDVSGRVVNDSTRAPLIGANVRSKANNAVATTDVNGAFTLKNVEIGTVLEISYIGFVTQQITVTRENASSIDIILKNDVSRLQEVSIVSNGYQTIAKERSAGSFAKPDLTVVVNRSTSMNILQRLDGLIPGLTVNNAPGQTASPYIIRGLTSVSISSSPLYVVDGIPIADVSSINPQDIADITVLKDATAASIWGSRAANGVIVIATKRGARAEKVRLTYDAFVNFQGKPDLNYFPVLNSQQFIQAARETFDPVAYPYNTVTLPNAGAGLAPHEVILYNQNLGRITAAQATASLDSLAAINNSRQIKDLFYRNAMLMNHTLSVSGGQKNYAFYSSLAYTDSKNNSPDQSNKTVKINIRQDFNVGKRIKLGLITDLSNNFGSSPRNLTVTNQFYPYQLFQDNAGNNISMPYMTTLPDAVRLDYETRSRINLNYNPLDEVNYGYNKTDLLLSRNIFNVNVKLIDGLSFTGTYSFIKSTSRTRDYDDRNSFRVRAQTAQFTVAPTATSTPVYNLPNIGGNYQVSNANQRNWTVRNQLDYNKSWKNGLHQLTLLAGQEVQEQFNVNNLSSIKGWDPLLQTGSLINYNTLNAGLQNPVWPTVLGLNISQLNDPFFGQAEVLSRFNSYFGNVAYTFDHKYAINGSYRIDKSNNFGLNTAAQNKPVWSVGGKWAIDEENFIKGVTWLDNLALRATYGIAGNAPTPGTAASYDIIAPTSNSFLPNGRGLQIATPANRSLTWEGSTTINLGVDVAVLNNRLSAAIDVYQKKTKDLLGYLPTNSLTGYPSIYGNLGDLENKGIELSLTSINLRKPNFTWSTTLNGAYNKNKITSLNISTTPVTTGSGRVSQQFTTGYPGYALFAYGYAGLDNLGDPQIRLADGTVTKALNASKPDDIKFMGSTQPKWSGGLSNNFTYKSFGLNLNAIFNLGHVMRRDVNNFYSTRLTHGSTSGGFTTGNVHADFLDRWRQPGDEQTTNIPSFVANPTIAARRDINYYTLADINVISASFIKMRDITLTYSLPQQFIKKIHAEGITLRAQVSNLMLWKANKDGIDPEFQNGYSGYRTLRTGQGTVSFGLNVRL
ncbi:SusC/RagA family TonB-linked outer membrane protein [Mucilaginibacter lacusdianchii]|uniref:SusC/RagA family TonB-linked outer membrane protein n=1 Tax=Mucilaginibacter lacusdianchii TaxID=2684211 RepID=UPI00131BB6B4|nr:SusC/RagA family TonB-linked outer membrane protein [Mucilaginibacter sp. JXJ CY 39]